MEWSGQVLLCLTAEAEANEFPKRRFQPCGPRPPPGTFDSSSNWDGFVKTLWAVSSRVLLSSWLCSSLYSILIS